MTSNLMRSVRSPISLFLFNLIFFLPVISFYSSYILKYNFYFPLGVFLFKRERDLGGQPLGIGFFPFCLQNFLDLNFFNLYIFVLFIYLFLDSCWFLGFSFFEREREISMCSDDARPNPGD